MSSEVKRWKATERPGPGAVIEVVDYSDYAALEAEVERLREKLAETKGQSETRWAGYVRESNLRREIEAALEAECERLRAQVSALQSDANSWQSGYDKGREDGAKAAEGWKAQHARDSAELRRLCAERDALRAENGRLNAELSGALTGIATESQAADHYRTELEVARGLLREVRQRCQLPDWARSQVDKLTAAPAPEAPDHIAEASKMAEQGERQEAINNSSRRALLITSYCADDDASCTDESPCADCLSMCNVVVISGGKLEHVGQFDQLPGFNELVLEKTSMDVRALVEALEECAASLAWNCLGECRAVHAGPIMPAAMALDTARAALSTHRQAQPQ